MSINPWGSDDPSEVAKGGTGNSTLTDHGVLLGSATSAVTVTSALSNGQTLIGVTGSDPSPGTISGDTNEISIGTGANSLSIGIADNAVLPGTGSFKWVDGTTAQEPGGSGGQTRYDTDTDTFRGYIDGTGWVDFATGSGGGGMWTQLQSGSYTANTAISVSAGKTYAIWVHNNTTSSGVIGIDVTYSPAGTFDAGGYADNTTNGAGGSSATKQRFGNFGTDTHGWNLVYVNISSDGEIVVNNGIGQGSGANVWRSYGWSTQTGGGTVVSLSVSKNCYLAFWEMTT